MSKHRIIVDCDKRSVVLKCSDQTEVTVYGIRASPLSNVISTMQAQGFMRKECEVFFALVLDSKRGQI